MTFVATFQEELTKAWRNSRALTAVATLMLGAFVVSFAGLVLDPRVIQGAPAWLKPAKFGISSAIYAGTLAWLFQYLRVWRRFTSILGILTALVLVIEVGIIDVQAARGTTSHFNVSSPLDAVLWGTMGLSIAVLWLASVGIAATLFRQTFADRPFGWALRLGMAMTVIGSASGGLMVTPTHEQQVTIAETHRATNIGGHTVGAKDGGPGLPGVGWSSKHGDLRIAHFLGLHAMQMIPLLFWVLNRRRRDGFTRGEISRAQTQEAFAIAASYLGLFGILVWQALRGQSILEPDSATGIAVAAWVVASAMAILMTREKSLESATRAIGVV